MPINTIFELAALAADGDAGARRRRDAAADPRSPPLLALRRRARRECTNATTTQCFDPRARRLGDRPARATRRARRGLLPEVVAPGHRRSAPLVDEVAERTRLGGARWSRCRDARHGVGRRRGAVPEPGRRPTSARARGRSSASRSTSRSSSDDSFAANLTNEGGVGRDVPRSCATSPGSGSLHECRRAWAVEGDVYGFDELVALAEQAAPLRLAHRPDDAVVRRARRRCRRASATFCARTGQPAPQDAAARSMRCILESLALKHAETVDAARDASPARAPTEIHIVGGGARNELLCRWTAEAAGLPVLAGPGGGDGGREPARCRRSPSASSARSRRRARSCAPRSRRRVYEPRGRGAWRRGARAVRGARRTGVPSAEVARDEAVERAARDRRRPRTAGTRRRGRPRRRSTRSSTARTCSAPTGRSRTSGGGNTSAKGTTVDHAGRETRVLWVKGSGTDLATITAAGFAGAAARRACCRCANATRWTTPTMVDYLVRSALRARPAAAVDRDAPARVRRRAARRPHASRRGDRAHVVARRAPARRGGVRRRERSGSTTSGPASTCRGGSRSCSRRTRRARAVLLAKHGLVTWGETGEESYRATIEFVTRAAHAIDGAAQRAVRPRRAARPRSSRTTRPSVAARRALPALRGALLADADGVILEVDRSPEAVAFASSARAPEVSQIGAPCPDHLINTKHKPLVVEFDPDARRRRRARGARSAPASSSTPPGTATTTSATSTTRRGSSRSTRPGRASCSSRASASSRAGSDAGRARVARDLYHRAIAVRGRGRRGRRLPVAERGRGVRDRVLAARALQAGAGAAARRARRARSRSSPAARAGSAARPPRLLADARRPRRRRGPERRGRGGGGGGARRARTARAARSPSRST